MVKELANDVTLSGQIEPAAYVTEIFAGDGTTTLFTLSDRPFRISTPTLLTDNFNQPSFNTQIWSITDPGSHLGLGGAGLTMSGGNGFDGQTTLAAIDTGRGRRLAGHRGGQCSAHLAQRRRPLRPLLRHHQPRQLLRRIQRASERWRHRRHALHQRRGGRHHLHHCSPATPIPSASGFTRPEMQRVLQTYYARVNGAIKSFGGGLVASPMALVFDVQDLGNASNTPATVLYDGAPQPRPPSAPSPRSTASNSPVPWASAPSPRPAPRGSSARSPAAPPRPASSESPAKASIVASPPPATLHSSPVASQSPENCNRLLSPRYRAVARLEDPASIAAEAAGGVPGTARWLGKVLKPVARSGADCESAAQAILAFASSRAAALAGSYIAINPRRHLARRRPQHHRQWPDP